MDTETLTVLAEHGIGFTILAPWQADEANLDFTQPYRVMLAGGLSIVVFFYHQHLSGGVSFHRSGPPMPINLWPELLPAYRPVNNPQLILVTWMANCMDITNSIGISSCRIYWMVPVRTGSRTHFSGKMAEGAPPWPFDPHSRRYLVELFSWRAALAR